MAALADGPRWLVGVLVTVALLTDLVDGRLARATGTTSELGARLDQEADALLILVLSAIVAADLGWWVLGIGLARYVFGALFTLVGPLRSPPARPRFWCKTVAVLVGIVLAAAAVLPLPDLVATVAVAVVAVLLAESFLHEAVDRWRAPGAPLVVPYGTVLAFLVVWLALVAPTERDHLTLTALLRLPLEVLVVVALSLVSWRRLRVSLTAASGLLLGVLLLVKVLDLSFNTVFDRDFDPVGDWAYLGPGVGVLGDSIGAGWARVVAVLAGLATLAVLVGVPLAMLRLVKVAAGHRRFSLTAATAFVSAWVLCFATGVQAVQRRAGRLDQRGVADRGRGAAGPGRPRGPARVLPGDRHRPVRRAGRGGPAGAALRAGRQGRAARLRRELRAGGCAGHVVLRGDHAGPRPGHPGARRRPATTRRAPSSPRRRSAPAAGWRTPACSPGSGSTASAATGSCSARTGSPSPTCSAGPAGAPSSTCRPTPRTGRRAEFYKFQGYYDSRNVDYQGPSSATRRCPTSTPSRSSAAASSRRPTGRP